MLAGFEHLTSLFDELPMVGTMKSKSRSEIEASLEPDLRQIFRQLIDDYNAAAKVHVPGWKGGANAGIVADLVRRGWRKKPSN
jgi:hypothetical protein